MSIELDTFLNSVDSVDTLEDMLDDYHTALTEGLAGYSKEYEEAIYKRIESIKQAKTECTFMASKIAKSYAKGRA